VKNNKCQTFETSFLSRSELELRGSVMKSDTEHFEKTIKFLKDNSFLTKTIPQGYIFNLPKNLY
jgi:hypothetical protein